MQYYIHCIVYYLAKTIPSDTIAFEGTTEDLSVLNKFNTCKQNFFQQRQSNYISLTSLSYFWLQSLMFKKSL